jgi:uncharacterized membrane protein YhfC
VVPWTSVIFSGISIILSLILPVVLALWFWRKTRVPFTTILIGALTFFVMQIVLRIPLVQILGLLIKPGELISTTAGLLLWSGFLALTAALFEELGRFLFFKVFRRQADWQNAVAFGIGHGGIEAMLLVGLNSIANTILLAILAADLPIELPSEVVEQFTSVASLDFLAGGIERLLTLPVHIALSILVVAGIRRKNFGYVLLAIGAHFLLNFPIIWLAQNWGIWPTEGYLLIWSIAALVLISRSRRLFAETEKI